MQFQQDNYLILTGFPLKSTEIRCDAAVSTAHCLLEKLRPDFLTNLSLSALEVYLKATSSEHFSHFFPPAIKNELSLHRFICTRTHNEIKWVLQKRKQKEGRRRKEKETKSARKVTDGQRAASLCSFTFIPGEAVQCIPWGPNVGQSTALCRCS